jgi:anti-sigma B factor antagonist
MAMSSANVPHLKTTMAGDVAVVEVLTRELKFPAVAQELGGELSLVAAQDWAKRLLINLNRVKYLSSTGFGVLVSVVRKARIEGRQVKFCNLDPEVRIGADIIGLDKVAEIYDTEPAALKAFRDG